MKKLLAVVAITGLAIACNNAPGPIKDPEDSLGKAPAVIDSTVNSAVDSIGKVVDSTKATIDSLTK